jgi:hypothetical protein
MVEWNDAGGKSLSHQKIMLAFRDAEVAPQQVGA